MMICCFWSHIWLGNLALWAQVRSALEVQLTIFIAVKVRVIGERWSFLLMLFNDLPWLGLALHLHYCADSSLWESHHNQSHSQTM